MSVYEKRACAVCGKKFVITKANTHLNTCRKCRHRDMVVSWQMQHRIPWETYTCETCGASFRRQYSTTLYCSRACWPEAKRNYDHLRRAS